MYHLLFANRIQEDFANLRYIKGNIIVLQTVFNKHHVIFHIMDLYVKIQQHNVILPTIYAPL